MMKQTQNLNFYHDQFYKTAMITDVLPTFIIYFKKIDDSRSHYCCPSIFNLSIQTSV